MPLVRRYDNRRRLAKSATKALQRLGFILDTQVLVMQSGEVYISCNTPSPAVAAILSDGVDAKWPAVDGKVVELYRREGVVRFQGASGGGMVGADVGRRPAAATRGGNNRK
jgi:hypothetical protein